MRLRDEQGLTFIHPFNDYSIMAGQGTIGLEILEQLPDVDMIFVPIGGGGLIAGLAYAVKNLRPQCRIIGVQAAGAPSMAESLKEGKIITLSSVDTVADGIKVNVTTIFTPAQVDEMVEAVDAETPSIISLFAGRIADTGVDPIPFMTESVKKAAAKPNCEVLWASTRELINIYQAEGCGCQIITVPNSILAKRKNIGRDPYEVSLDTVRGFAKDIASLGFHILP